MSKHQFGVQTYTVRRLQKKDIKSTYKSLSDMGVKSIEISRIDFTKENAKTVSEACREYGITVSALQVKPKYVFGDTENIINFAHTVGAKTVVISMLPFRCILGGEDKFYAFLSSLDPMSERYRKEGITLAYHHHNWEYITLKNGRTRMEELLWKTELISFVNDTYWTARCGRAPAKQIQEFGTRLAGIHLRDLAFYKKWLSVIPRDTAVGSGLIDVSEVLFALGEVSPAYLVIEQNSGAPLSDIKKSLSALSDISTKMNNKELL